MHTISVSNRKGGVGKTTVATNLARALHLRGHEVILIDTDEQGSARDWAATESDVQVPMTVGVDRPVVHEEIPRLNGYDFAVVDGVAKMQRMNASAVKAADLVLIPIRPSALDNVDRWGAGGPHREPAGSHRRPTGGLRFEPGHRAHKPRRLR